MVATFWPEVVPMLRKALLALLVVVVVFAAAPVYADPATYNGYPVVSVNVNGAPLKSDVPPIIMDGRTLVPLRAAAGALGATVGYDSATGTVSINGGGAGSAALAKDAFSRILAAHLSIVGASDQAFMRALNANYSGNLSNQDMAAAALQAKQTYGGVLDKVVRLIPPADAYQVRLYAVQALQAQLMNFDTVYMAFAGVDAKTKSDAFSGATAMANEANKYREQLNAAFYQWQQSNGLQ